MEIAENRPLVDLIEAWETNNRINALLLERIPEAGLAATLSTRGGRNIARQFAHLHTQRVRWLEARGGQDLAQPLPQFASKEQPSREQLLAALEASCRALGELFRDLGTGVRPLKSQRKGLTVSVAYFIAHESHHRGSILLTLKQCGHRLDKSTLYGIWDWHRR